MSINSVKRLVNDIEVETWTDTRSRNSSIRWSSISTWLLLGMVSGCRSLREVEDLSEEGSRTLQRVLKVGGRVSDTKLYQSIGELCEDELQRSLTRQVKAAHRRGGLEPESLPMGVIAIDGKNLSTVRRRVYLEENHPGVQIHKAGSAEEYGLIRVFRAHLVSARSRLCVLQETIPADTNEMGHIVSTWRRLKAAYGHTNLFEVFAADAGNCSQALGREISSDNFGYFFALKGNNKDLYNEAKRLLGDSSKPDIVRKESRNGRVETRRLFRAKLEVGWLEWEHARLLVRIERTVCLADGTLVSVGNRYFVTNLRHGRLQPEGWLTLVRRYWDVENAGHWTADVIWEEDKTRAPWRASPEAIIVLGLLRMLGLNIARILRIGLRRAREPTRVFSWNKLREALNRLIVGTVHLELKGVSVTD